MSHKFKAAIINEAARNKQETGSKRKLSMNVITSGRLEQSTGTKMQGFEEIV